MSKSIDLGSMLDTSDLLDAVRDEIPIHAPRALKLKPEDVLGAVTLDNFVSSPSRRPTSLGLSLKGRQVPQAEYTKDTELNGVRVEGKLDPDRVYAFLDDGATLVLPDVDEFIPEVAAISQAIGNIVKTDVKVTAFLTPPRKMGFAPHADAVEVLAIQLHGEKEWKLWERVAMKGTQMRLETDTLGPPRHTLHLSPGDVLYFPTGTPHAATTTASTSLHLSFGWVPGPQNRAQRNAHYFERLFSVDLFDETTRLNLAQGVALPDTEGEELVVRRGSIVRSLTLEASVINSLRHLSRSNTLLVREVAPQLRPPDALALCKQLVRLGIVTQTGKEDNS